MTMTLAPAERANAAPATRSRATTVGASRARRIGSSPTQAGPRHGAGRGAPRAPGPGAARAGGGGEPRQENRFVADIGGSMQRRVDAHRAGQSTAIASAQKERTLMGGMEKLGHG